jgi:7,8-dihydropterin-6-yl-methyl-4-(beta-D-ribofuranosyl)aminobenzene 5'-phosphate synthase
MRITTVYDNKALHLNLASAWGFACVVDDDVLFDTGGDGRRLLSNVAEVAPGAAAVVDRGGCINETNNERSLCG